MISDKVKSDVEVVYNEEVVKQEEYFNKTGFYEQKKEWVVDGVSYQVDVYNGPNGKGFVLNTSAKDQSDDEFIHKKGYGAEDRDEDWNKVVASDRDL